MENLICKLGNQVEMKEQQKNITEAKSLSDWFNNRLNREEKYQMKGQQKIP